MQYVLLMFEVFRVHVEPVGYMSLKDLQPQSDLSVHGFSPLFFVSSISLEGFF